MNSGTAKQDEVEKLREWVDDLRVKHPTPPLEAPAVETKQGPAASRYEPSEGVRRTQKLLESIDLRRQERARLLGALKSRQVEVEREDHATRQRLTDNLKAINDEMARRVLKEQADAEGSVAARAAELHAKDQQIQKLDTTIEQLRIQLDAELGKIGAKVTA
jgi:hypothetical protein